MRINKILVILISCVAIGFAGSDGYAVELPYDLSINQSSVDSTASFSIQLYVKNYGASDTVGVHWYFYDLADPEGRYNPKEGINNFSIVDGNDLFVSGDVGMNFPDPAPSHGDSIIFFGSWDSCYNNNPGTYGTNQNHTGFYWLYSDIAVADPTSWQDDTMRVMPKPIATQIGGPYGDILISITNPKETRYNGQTAYDVMGFWIWADTTSGGIHPDTAGRPDYFDLEVGFFSVNGDPGEITICTHSVSIYRDEQKVYWAYKLVARPSFSLKGSRQAPGYTTHYLSQNSNPIVIVGIEENKDINHSSMQLEISPNPFTNRTDIRFQITENQMQDVRSKNQEASLEIYDCSGRLVKSFNLTSVILLHASAVPWDGTDESGEQLPSGVYFIQAKGGDLNLTKKVILQRE